MKKNFTESEKGRIYQKGLHLLPQDIATIHKRLETKSFKEVAEDLKMDIRTVKKYSNGNSTQKIGGNRKHNQLLSDFVESSVKLNPAIYLKELNRMLLDEGFRTNISSISRVLKELGFTRRKVVKICYYRTTPRVQSLRSAFRAFISNFHPGSFLYLDESHFDSETMEVTF